MMIKIILPIIGFLFFLLIYIIALKIYVKKIKSHINNCVEMEIERGFKKIGINFYKWKNEDNYKELKQAIWNKLVDHRSSLRFKPRYKEKDPSFLKQIYETILYFYEYEIIMNKNLSNIINIAINFNILSYKTNNI